MSKKWKFVYRDNGTRIEERHVQNARGDPLDTATKARDYALELLRARAGWKLLVIEELA